MNEIIILDGSEVKLNESKSGKLTIIAGENASIPLSLLPTFKKRDVTVKTVKDLKDPCEIAFALGQVFKPGDTLITSRPEFARFKEYADVKPTKARAKTESPAKRARKPKEAPEQKETEKEAEGAMPKPIEAEEKKEENSSEKEKKSEKAKEEKTESGKTEEGENADTLGGVEALPTDAGYTKFTTFLKGLGISSAFSTAAKKLYKLSLDNTSLKIMAQSDLKGLPSETAEKIKNKIKEIKGL